MPLASAPIRRHTARMGEIKLKGPSVEAVPEGDDRTRLVCPDCGYIEYDNPKVVVGAVCDWMGEILMCRRAIPPRKGFWTFPAGFMEIGETMAEGAAREVREEACAEVEIGSLIGVYEVPSVSHIYVLYRARMLSGDFAPGPESADVALFPWHEMPWDELAFPSIRWGLKRYHEGGAPHVHVALPGAWEEHVAETDSIGL